MQRNSSSVAALQEYQRDEAALPSASVGSVQDDRLAIAQSEEAYEAYEEVSTSMAQSKDSQPKIMLGAKSVKSTEPSPTEYTQVHTTTRPRNAPKPILHSRGPPKNRVPSTTQVRGRRSFRSTRKFRPGAYPVQLRRNQVALALRAGRERQRSGSMLKPMWASVSSSKRPSAVINGLWNKQIARMNRHFFEDQTEQAVPTLDPAAYGWVQFTLERLENPSTFSMDNIPHQAIRGQQWMFMQICFWLLRYEPNRLIDFLRATHVEPYPPINWIEDCLSYLGRYFARVEDKQKPGLRQELLALFHVLVWRATNESVSFINGFVRDLLPYCTAEEAVWLYETIRDCEVDVHGFTLLHLAARCAKDGQFEAAASALLQAKDAGVVVNRENYRSVCSTVIRSCMSQPEGLRVCLDLVSQLVDTGLQLNGPICDIIMLNAVDAGDVNTAFSIYRSLIDRGLKPRQSTFAILLKGCKLNIDDADMLNGVIRDAISEMNVRQSSLLATEILHCLALHHTKHNPDTALRTITEAYAQLFDMTPLRQLGLPLPPIQQKRATFEDAIPPSPHALGFMISASIQRIQSYSERPDDIATIYARWRELVEMGTHPVFSQLATTDHIANIFLMAFIRTPSGLIHASRVVRDMQRSLPSPAHPSPSTLHQPIIQCKPTVQTWSIFLHGFTRHGKTRLADQVLTYMRGKGIEPNDVTWNTLITGHARAQDVERTFEVLREAEQSGLVWSRWTERGVGWLRDRGRVAREMERRRRRIAGEGLDFVGELKGALGEKLAKGVEVWEDGDGGDRSGGASAQKGDGAYEYVPNPGFAGDDVDGQSKAV